MTSHVKLDAEIKRELEQVLAQENSLCSCFVDARDAEFHQDSNSHVLYLTICKFTPETAIKEETERLAICPRYLGFLTSKEVHDDCLFEFPLNFCNEEYHVSFKNHGAIELNSSEFRNLCWFHFALLESVGFQGKIFAIAANRENKDVLRNLLEDMKNFMRTTSEESWYLLTPLLENEVQDYYITANNKQYCLGHSLIDHGYARDVVASIRNFLHPGVLLPDLENPTTVITSTYNISRYVIHQPMKTISFKDMFQKNYRIKDDTRMQPISYEQYYKTVLNITDLDFAQKLICSRNTVDGPFVRNARLLMNPESPGAKITLHSSKNMFLVQALFCVHPLRTYTLTSLTSILVTCWQFESMLKVAELRMNLVSRSSIVSGKMLCPPINSIFEAMTVKALKEYMDYERIEFLGDTVLKLVISLHVSFSASDPAVAEHSDDGRHYLLCNGSLARVCISYGLNKYIRLDKLGDHSWRLPGHHLIKEIISKYDVFPQDLDMWYKPVKANYRHKVLADVVESVIGAFYIHRGFLAAVFITNELGIAPIDYMLHCANEQDNHGSDAWMKSFLEWIPYTHESCSIDTDKLKGLENAMNYKYSNKGLLIAAMIRNTERAFYCGLTYTTLASLGDALLDILVIETLWNQRPEMKVGELTSSKQYINNKDKLYELAVVLEFDKFVDFVNDASNEEGLYQYLLKDRPDGYVPDEEEIYRVQLASFMRCLVTVTYLDSYGSLLELRRVWNPLLKPIMKIDGIVLQKQQDS